MRHPAQRRARGPRTRTSLAAVLTGAALVGGTLTGVAAASSTAATAARTAQAAQAVQTAAETEYRRGPDPTPTSVQAPDGPFTYERITVPAQAGFGGGTIYAPTNLSQGTFGAVAISPGYSANQSSIAWYGRKPASNGFVVFTINVLDTYNDQPPARGRQLLAALDYLTGSSAVRGRIDAGRLAVAGHSMGGGGALNAAYNRPGLRAAVPLTPWHLFKNWSGVRVPTLIVGADGDTAAPVEEHAEPFYQSLTAAPERAYLELKGAGHLAPTRYNATIGSYTLAWLKRYVDNDTRYERFLCPAPRPGGAIAEYRSSCPGS
ncbi:alpha/beta hydrolase [Streptomyces sp. B1866]|uniref:alpha/beta hydrolase family protein n=1 Tax=Streptomyces sp. B1866 TaxID=3075431 RepID=UPI00288F3D2E|nr:alpha/beta hydrolase [Streptomyces sp. B1866]MDT3399071.1 alpha/beta hydrolase [Streptomyces sp. B1866]